MRFNQIKAGDKLVLNDGSDFNATFLGFTRYEVEKYSDKPVFDNMDELKHEYGIRNIGEIGALGSHMEYGHNVYAIFGSMDEFNDNNKEYVFGAYVCSNRWSVGSSARPLKIVSKLSYAKPLRIDDF